MSVRELIARTCASNHRWETRGSGRDPEALTPDDIRAAIGCVRDPLAADLILAHYAGHKERIESIAAGLGHQLEARILAKSSGPVSGILAVAPIAKAALSEYLEAKTCRVCNGRGQVFMVRTGRHASSRQYETIRDLERLHQEHPDGQREVCNFCGGTGRAKLTARERSARAGIRLGARHKQWYEAALNLLLRREEHGVQRVTEALFGEEIQ